jgi:hypothetical protein
MVERFRVEVGFYIEKECVAELLRVL